MDITVLSDFPLDVCARLAHLAEEMAVRACNLTQETHVQDLIAQCQEAAHQAVVMAIKAGATSPYRKSSLEEKLDPRDADTLDTPPARELHRRLVDLLPLAEEVDAETAEALARLAHRLEDGALGVDRWAIQPEGSGAGDA